MKWYHEVQQFLQLNFNQWQKFQKFQHSDPFGDLVICLSWILWKIVASRCFGQTQYSLAHGKMTTCSENNTSKPYTIYIYLHLSRSIHQQSKFPDKKATQALLSLPATQAWCEQTLAQEGFFGIGHPHTCQSHILESVGFGWIDGLWSTRWRWIKAKGGEDCQHTVQVEVSK